MINKRVFAVWEVNSYIKSILEEDVLLSEIFVEGEISNLKYQTSGHLYFTLKDSYAAISCVMFKTNASSLKFNLENGMKVIIFGRVSLYEKTGNYQIYIDFLEPYGKGGLFLAFEQLKESLKSEGLFEASHKKPIPKNPSCIAIVTSKTSAALQDVITVCKRRNKNISLVVVHTSVQGDAAPHEICSAIGKANRYVNADLIILCRGGGSIEDLWAFNDEAVAYSIYNSKLPIISAIGHETDFTIADFVSDLRAPTPSAAAEIAVPDLRLQIDEVLTLKKSLQVSIENKITFYKSRLEKATNNKYLKSPLTGIYEKQIYVADLSNKLKKEMDFLIETKKTVLKNKIDLLNSLSPLNILSRGFSIASKENKIVKSISDLTESDNIELKFVDGTAKANITSIASDNDVIK